MSVETRWGHFFKPEVRSKGTREFEAGNVVLSSISDTGIQGFVKGTASSKVTLKSDGITSPFFKADCSCPTAAKGNLCRHVWAVLLQTEKKHPDFLEMKTDIEKPSQERKTESPLKAKQAEHRKRQYQQMKARAQERKRGEKKFRFAPPPPSYPDDVAEALEFFRRNGFPFEEPLNAERVNTAKKQLARIFHPDRGGSHDEAVTLNRHAKALLDFI